MNKDLIKTLVVLGLVIAGMAISIVFFTRPKESGKTSESSEVTETKSAIETEIEGPFSKEGDITAISSDTIAISTDEGELRARSSEAVIKNEEGETSDYSYLARGVRVSVKGEAGVLYEIKVVSSPDVVVFSPNRNDPVGLIFKIDGAAKTDKGDLSVEVKNRRTGRVYLESSAAVNGNRYGAFSFPVNLSSALDIMDGDTVDIKFSHEEGAAAFETHFRYAGGMASKIKVYFVRSGNCALTPVDRLIDSSKSSVREGIEEIIRGPSAEEKKTGLTTALTSTVKIRSLNLKDGIVTVDFSSDVLKSAACGISYVRQQITRTILQFPGVSEVSIMVNGEEGRL
ncbi:MAG: GerMN domain-containing protein [Candidatus Colwellbacteria bacterium]|nr:GerMN domain-containing protein [Candidatus Colwellbacteria bacterium]